MLSIYLGMVGCRLRLYFMADLFICEFFFLILFLYNLWVFKGCLTNKKQKKRFYVFLIIMEKLEDASGKFDKIVAGLQNKLSLNCDNVLLRY